MTGNISSNGSSVGSQATISGATTPLQDQTESAVLRNALSINFDVHNCYATNQPFMNMIYGARLVDSSTSPATGADGMAPDITTRLPMQVPGTILKIFWVTAKWGARHPMLSQRYVIRHNLDRLAPGRYSFLMRAGFTLISRKPGVLVVDLTDLFGNAQFQIKTPAGGAFPAGWTIEMVRQSDLAAYDDDTKDALDATRIFTPEYLAELSRIAPAGGKGPGMIRFMKPSKVEATLMTDVDELTRATDYYFAENGTVWPPEFMCSLCNYFDAAAWITTPMQAGDDLIDHIATIVATTLRPDLQVWVECANEAWNWQYREIIRSNAALAIERFGTQGPQPGTVSITKGAPTITATGVDLTTVFGVAESLAQNIVIDGMLYPIDAAMVTARSMPMTAMFKGAFTTATNVSYLIPDKAGDGRDIVPREPGYMIRAANMAQRWISIFTARGERSRLKTQLGSLLASPRYAQTLLQADFWRGEPDFVEPNSVFDYLSVNTYFGSDLFSAPIKAQARTYLPGDQAGFNAFLGRLVEGTDPTFSINREFPRIQNELAQIRAVCDTYGVKLSAYEGGTHISHTASLRRGDTDLVDAMVRFNYSPKMQSLYTTMCNNAAAYTDAPDNSKFRALVAFADTNPVYYKYFSGD